MDFWMRPGVAVQVNALTKVTMLAALPGEEPPPGAMVVPPDSALPPHVAMIRQAAEHASEAIAKQAAVANQAVKAASAEVPNPPPWSVTFTEAK